MVQPSMPSESCFFSPGLTWEFEIIGACCPLYDREQLPYPSCSLAWKGKQPSWRRIGPRFVADMSSHNFEAYAVRNLSHEPLNSEPKIWVFTYRKPSKELMKWWYKNRNL